VGGGTGKYGTGAIVIVCHPFLDPL
jgi:hypothetical protein